MVGTFIPKDLQMQQDLSNMGEETALKPDLFDRKGLANAENQPATRKTLTDRRDKFSLQSHSHLQLEWKTRYKR